MKSFIFIRSALVAASCSLSVFALSTSANAANLTPVDLELSLLVDISRSMDNNEFSIQRQGYGNVFNDPSLFNNFNESYLQSDPVLVARGVRDSLFAFEGYLLYQPK